MNEPYENRQRPLMAGVRCTQQEMAWIKTCAALQRKTVAGYLRDSAAAVERVRDLAQEWAAKAPPDDWGDDMSDTVLADAGREILALLEAS